MSAPSSRASSPEQDLDDIDYGLAPLDQTLQDAIFDDDLEAARAALQAGANPNCHDIEPIFAFARSKEMISLLYLHGAKVSRLKMSNAARSLLVGLPGGDACQDTDPATGTPSPLCRITNAQFRSGRFRRFGTANPEKMDVPFWRAMVEARCWAYLPRKKFPLEKGDDLEDVIPADPEYENGTPLRGGPIWCFDRFGQSLTELPDGTFVQIAGEHEDGYDPDFMIYNDVVVHHPDSTAQVPKFDIYGYPRDVFPPTDFHTATYVPKHNAIYIIGNNGYSSDENKGLQERGETPVYRLEIGTWKIEKVVTGGGGPGCIWDHHAQLVGDEITICADRDDYNQKYMSGNRAKRWVIKDGKAQLVDVGLDETWWLSLESWTWRYTNQD